MASLIHETHALCPRCDRVLTARLIENQGDVYLDATCDVHGATSTLYFRDADFYRRLASLRNEVACCDTFDCARGGHCAERAAHTMIYMVNVTNNCNMTCDACLSGSELGKAEPYRPGAELIATLPDARGLGYSPHAVFFGGEPTMHPDLEDMVRRVIARGYVPRLATNGLKLRDDRYAARLAAAGLRWVFLHFDSLDDTKNQRLRGRPMLDASIDAIRTAQAAGMKVQLGATISRENLGELSALLDFAQRQGVFWVSLYPVAEIERHGSSGSTYLTDIVDALDEQTGGRIRRDDFVASARLWSGLYRVTGRYNYRQKPTMLSLPTVLSDDGLVPLSRMVNPLYALGHGSALRSLAQSLPSLLDYEKREPSGRTLIINIQQFQGRSAFDLEEAVHSLMSFSHEGGFYPFDIFNHVHRYAAPVVPAAALRRQSA